MTAPTAVRRPTGIGRAGVALAAVSALSSAPSAFYHVVQDTTGAAWTTSLLFVAYGSAQLVTTATVAARPRWSPDRTARAGFVLLLVGG
ncbi:MAG: hypothetical protein HGA44_17725, partial [Cellulomonadaceae bacterium]|nr:hypothetical protein [Cellulomonadaceae bacterium]